MVGFWRSRLGLRAWVGIGAAYVLALQLLLAGVATAHLAAPDASSGDLFVTCLGHSAPTSDQGTTDQKPSGDGPCVFCTLAHAACTLPQADQDVSSVEFLTYARVVRPGDDRVAVHHSPTGHYQRGPPTTMRFVG